MNRKIRVLVVDDDSLLRKLVTEQLAKGEFDAAPAARGQQALDILREADYDVVLLDIMMAGLSGLNALREIRKLEDPPEVIMLTADTSLSTGIEAMRHGAYDYLTKPATLDEMEAIIRKADEKAERFVAFGRPAGERRRRGLANRSSEPRDGRVSRAGRECGAHGFYDSDYRRVGHGQRCARAFDSFKERAPRHANYHRELRRVPRDAFRI